ncbi:phosphatase PAP2 family protein [Echinicola pacifica]|uniref:Phosphatase PAP2 family protein n=1 Tax=Echinicola pacifica TaxID=346377 RepID=A0A918Q540_9BACT|nr:phosphatase PAP2 family protein [Echinicola pacifica]GGZ31412.1 phosphatase PAP2 family protein [Echinicola pacifica]
MIETIKDLDEKLFILLNSFHQDWLDEVMYAISGTALWLPLYALLAYFIIKTQGKASIWVFIGIALAILFSDQTTSGLMKPYFERLRPCHDLRWDSIMHNYRHCGGMYGFASSHASNTFSLATFMNLAFRGNNRYLKWLFPWAIIVSYSRIYLGVHYPADVFVGATVGILAGFAAYWVAFRLQELVTKQVLGQDQ